MTNKTEDRFYFGKPGQPERFAGYGAWHPTAPFVPKPQGAHRYKKGDRVVSHEGRNPRTGVIDRPVRDMYGNPEYVVYWDNDGGTRQVADQYLTKMSRPGQPERFAASGWQTIEAYVQVLAEEFGTPRGKEAAQVMLRAAESLGGSAPAALRNAIRIAATSKNVTDRGRAIGQIEDMIESASFSRPGSPDKFDASSLDRGNFAEASKSPILGKLLAAKVMPDGGWRAVQAGSDTLVISFEDADLARDFGRRASTKGYSATSPVATTGRYWNVEVKNGK